MKAKELFAKSLQLGFVRILPSLGVILLFLAINQILDKSAVVDVSSYIATILLICNLSRFGYDNYILKERYKANLDVSATISISLSILYSLVYFCCYFILSINIQDHILVTISIIPLTLLYIHLSNLKAEGEAKYSALLEIGSISFYCLLLFLSIVIFFSPDVLLVKISYVAVMLTVCAILWRKRSFKFAIVRLNKQLIFRDVKRRYFYFLVSIIFYFHQWGAVLVWDAYLSGEYLNYLTFYYRLIMALAFISIVINNITAPKFSKLKNENINGECKKLFITSLVLSLFFSAPVTFVLLFYSEFILNLLNFYSAEFTRLFNYLVLYSFLMVVFGTSANYLMMTGRVSAFYKVLFLYSALGIIFMMIFMSLGYINEGLYVFFIMNILRVLHTTYVALHD